MAGDKTVLDLGKTVPENEGVRPYLEIFLILHPDWTDADFDGLITDLQNRGYGWLKPTGVRSKLTEMGAAQKRRNVL